MLLAYKFGCYFHYRSRSLMKGFYKPIRGLKLFINVSLLVLVVYLFGHGHDNDYLLIHGVGFRYLVHNYIIPKVGRIRTSGMTGGAIFVSKA